MQRAERRLADREGRAVRTLAESDYLLGVADETRLCAHFASAGSATKLSRRRPAPGCRLSSSSGSCSRSPCAFSATRKRTKILQLIVAAPLGGGRPKTSVIDQHGSPSIAKFPKETCDYSIETWAEIALRLASKAGLALPQHELIEVAGKAVMLSRRFDRNDAVRVPFLSAMGYCPYLTLSVLS